MREFRGVGGESRRQGSFLLSEKEERNNVSPGAYSNSTLIKILKKDILSSFDKGKKIRVGFRPQLEEGLSRPITPLKERAGSLRGGISGPLG